MEDVIQYGRVSLSRRSNSIFVRDEDALNTSYTPTSTCQHFPRFLRIQRTPPLPRVVHNMARFGEPGTVGAAGVEGAAGEEGAMPSPAAAAVALTS